jgi:GNAT superfamily N-acetyltransferase
MTSAVDATPASPLIRQMRESDIPIASAVFRRAFGTFLGLPDPDTFSADREYLRGRWHADPTAALVAEVNGSLAGSNLATRWGSFAFFGPLTVEPALSNRGIAKMLLAATMEIIDGWQVRDAALFTFSNSTKHIHLYQGFGFWPRSLTALLSKPPVEHWGASFDTFSPGGDSDRAAAIDACRGVADSVYPGLDLSSEIRVAYEQQLGETVLLWGRDSLDAFAVCHQGAGTEAGENTCYIKFAAARSGPRAQSVFELLLRACEVHALQCGLKRIEAGVNTARSHAYRTMLRIGYRADSYGIAMHRNDSPAYNRPDCYVVDDLR